MDLIVKNSYKMKYFFIIVLSITILNCTGQAQDKNEFFLLSGNVNGRDTGNIVLWHTDTLNNWIKDTAFLQKGCFKFKGLLKEPSYAHLIGSNAPGNYASFYLEKGEQTIKLEENNFDAAKMEGSKTQKENNLLYQQLNTIDEKISNLNKEYSILNTELENQIDSISKEKEIRKVEVENGIQTLLDDKLNLRIVFIAEHSNSYVSPTELLGLINVLSLNLEDSLFNNFTQEIKQSRAAKLCKEEIEKRRVLRAGIFLPNFSTVDVNGKEISLFQFKGRFVLLDFWASWCIPCRKAIPDLKQIYKRYNNKGFEVIAISTDKKEQQWKDAIIKEKIDSWVNIRKDQQLEKIFESIRVLPMQLLVDPEGKIIWSSFEENSNGWQQLLEKRLK